MTEKLTQDNTSKDIDIALDVSHISHLIYAFMKAHDINEENAKLLVKIFGISFSSLGALEPDYFVSYVDYVTNPQSNYYYKFFKEYNDISMSDIISYNLEYSQIYDIIINFKHKQQPDQYIYYFNNYKIILDRKNTILYIYNSNNVLELMSANTLQFLFMQEYLELLKRCKLLLADSSFTFKNACVVYIALDNLLRSIN